MEAIREFIPINDFMTRCLTRSQLESIGQEGEIVKIDKKSCLSYTDGNKTHESYSVIAEKNGVITPPGFAIALLYKIKNTNTGKLIKYKIIPLRNPNTFKPEVINEIMNAETLAIPIR